MHPIKTDAIVSVFFAAMRYKKELTSKLSTDDRPIVQNVYGTFATMKIGHHQISKIWTPLSSLNTCSSVLAGQILPTLLDDPMDHDTLNSE